MGHIKTGSGPYTPAAHTVRATSGGTNGGSTIKSTPTTAAPSKGNPEAFKAAHAKVNKSLSESGEHHGSGHGATAVYGDEHKAHDKPAVVSHKTHLAHGAAEGLVVAGEKAAHALGHSKAGHVAHVMEHGAHKFASKLSPIGAAAAVANAVHNPSLKTGGEATSATLMATKEVVKARAGTAATKAAQTVLTKAAGRSTSAATKAIVKAEAPKVAAAISKTVSSGKNAAAVAKAGETAAAALVKSGVKSTAAVVAKAAPKAAQAAGVAAAKAGGRFVPGLNIAIAATDAVVAGADMKKAYDKPTTKNVTVAVVSGITAAGSALAATNIPVVSQIGAGVSVVTGLGKAALESFWPD